MLTKYFFTLASYKVGKRVIHNRLLYKYEVGITERTSKLNKCDIMIEDVYMITFTIPFFKRVLQFLNSVIIITEDKYLDNRKEYGMSKLPFGRFDMSTGIKKF